MSTKIEWTDETWNPVRGCSRCSPGCDNCYAKDLAYRFKGKGLAYEGLATLRKNKIDWTGVVREIPDALDKPLRWQRPRMIFVNSQSDLFHESLDFEYIAAVFGVMAAAPQHTFQILTKRAERLPEFEAWLRKEARTANAGRGMSEIFRCLVEAQRRCEHKALRKTDQILMELGRLGPQMRQWPLPNVWLGVSVEMRRYLPRIDRLLETAAAKHMVSFEPLLEDLGDLGPWLHDSTCLLVTDADAEGVDGLCTCSEPREVRIDWGIVGGESGDKNVVRPYDLAWGERAIRQFKNAGVPVFHKQVGSKPFVVVDEPEVRVGSKVTWAAMQTDGKIRMGLKYAHPKGGDPSEWPKALRVREFPKVTP